MICTCLDTVDARLRDKGLTLSTLTPLSSDLTLLATRVTIRCEWLGKSRKALPVLLATYCPWCGVAYEEDVPAPVGALGDDGPTDSGGC